MANKKSDEAKFAGCALSLLQLAIVTPIWFMLLYGLLDRTDAPTWQWTLYWVYLPVTLTMNFIRTLFELVLGD